MPVCYGDSERRIMSRSGRCRSGWQRLFHALSCPGPSPPGPGAGPESPAVAGVSGSRPGHWQPRPQLCWESVDPGRPGNHCEAQVANAACPAPSEVQDQDRTRLKLSSLATAPGADGPRPGQLELELELS